MTPITLALWALTSLTACRADRDLTIVRPSDTVDDYPGLSAVYLRIPWSYIEPEEGKFVWSVLDSPAQRRIAKGKQIA